MAETTHIRLVKPEAAERLDVDFINGNSDILDEEIWKRGKTLNGEGPDSNGNFVLREVPFARQIVTEDAQQSSGDYIFRTTGGDASLSDGDAMLVALFGRMEHTGYVAESITGSATHSSAAADINIDRDTFVAYVAASGTITLSYTTGWSADPALYGITFDWTPANGDTITIVYVKENLGTITPSSPSAFRSTGWNLYDHSSGYAKVKKYSTQYGMKVGGMYTALQFSETVSGARTTITPVNGYFMVPSDGYVFVTGGNSTDTYIIMTWSNWTDGYEGDFSAYTESVISLSSAMTSFPYGLMAVGAVADEINLNIGKTISRIERQANNSSNMAAAEASGRDFVFDTNYIYIVRETPVESTIDISGVYTASDHGLEIIDGTTVPVHVQTLYGRNLVDKLRTDVVTISEQELTDEQKAQVRENIGAGTGIIAISVSSSSSTSKSVSAPGLTANHRLILETPVLSIADITLTPGNGELTVACSAGIPAMKLAAYLPA